MRSRFIKIAGLILLVPVILFCFSLAYVQVNKEKLLIEAIDKIRERVKGDLVIGSENISLFRNFPWPSVHLEDVSIKDDSIDAHGYTLFQAKDIYLSLDVIDAVKGNSPVRGLRIDNGSAYLFTDSNGRNNTNIFQERKGKGSSNINKIELNNFLITIDDRRKPKRHQFFANHVSLKPDKVASGYDLKAKLDIRVDSLAFNAVKGGYLKNHKIVGKIDATFNNGVLVFRNQELEINKQDYKLNAEFNLIQKNFSLNVKTGKIPYEKVKFLLTPKAFNALSMFSLESFKMVDANIKGSLAGGQPLITISSSVKNSDIKSPFMDFTGSSFKVSFHNKMNDAFAASDSNTHIVISDFEAKWRNIKATSSQLLIANLTNPVLKADLASAFKLSQLDEVLSSRTMSFNNGTARVNIQYNGPIKRDETTNGLINGVVTINDGNILYKPRQIKLEDVDARLTINNSDVTIEHLNTKALGQSFFMKGYGKQFMTLMQNAPSLATLDWEIKTPSLDLTRIMWLLRKPESVSYKGNGGNVTGVANRIDDVLEKGKLNVKFSTPSVRYGEFNARNLLADVSLLQDQYVLHRISMDHAGGSFEMNGSLSSVQGSHNVKLVADMKDVDVSEVFASFNNFGQDGIMSQSISGKLSSKATATFRLSNEGKILPSTLSSIIDFSLLNGALVNYEPVKKLQKFIFKNRDFENIRFAELKNRLEVNNREVKINRMEINSSVMWMYIEGLYSQRGNTDISIQVPLKNIKKRDELNPENAGLKKGGSSIYIRGRPGDDGNIKFKLDLFNRFEKEKKNVSIKN